MIHQWKKALVEGAAEVFQRGRTTAEPADAGRIKELHAKIGELTVERDFLEHVSLLKIPSGHGIGVPMKAMVADVR